MIILEFEGIEIDRCLTCQGTWLDHGELELLLERAGLDSAPLAAVLRSGPATVSSNRKCPRCGKRLQMATIATNPPLELDRCPKEHGIWLDYGELGALVHHACEGDVGKLAEWFGDMLQDELGQHASVVKAAGAAGTSSNPAGAPDAVAPDTTVGDSAQDPKPEPHHPPGDKP
jgi:Zn-finger nucleic acid-binding protein